MSKVHFRNIALNVLIVDLAVTRQYIYYFFHLGFNLFVRIFFVKRIGPNQRLNQLNQEPIMVSVRGYFRYLYCLIGWTTIRLKNRKLKALSIRPPVWFLKHCLIYIPIANWTVLYWSKQYMHAYLSINAWTNYTMMNYSSLKEAAHHLNPRGKYNMSN